MSLSFSFFFNDPATTEIYSLSLHDALPISAAVSAPIFSAVFTDEAPESDEPHAVAKSTSTSTSRVMIERVSLDHEDRKSTRLNSSHQIISYAVFCLKKKKSNKQYRYNNSTI